MRMLARFSVVLLILGLATTARAAALRIQLHPDPNAWTAFADGDELVATGGGKVDWYRNNRVIAQVNDPLGLVGENYDPAMAALRH